MSKTVKIIVTKKDILKGKRGSPTSCPVALACHRIKELRNYSVDVHYFYLKRSGSLYKHTKLYKHIKIPLKIQGWIKDFDTGRPVKPISFYVEVSDGK